MPETWPITELVELGEALRERIRMSVAAIMVNGLWPEDFAEFAEMADLPPGLGEVGRVGAVGRQQRESIASWQASDVVRRCATSSLLTLPWQWGGLPHLEAVRAWLGQARAAALHGGSQSVE